MRDIGDRRFDFPGEEEKEDSMWWFKGLLLVAIVCMVAAYFLVQRSFALEYAAVGRPPIGELVERDKTREQMLLEEHYKYRSYETHSDEDRAGLTAIIMGGE